MTAILSDELPGARLDESEQGPESDAMRREMVSLRARVRRLAEQRAATEADRFTQELRVVTDDAARAMNSACGDRTALARLHHRLTRQVNADLLLVRGDDEASVDAGARALLLARLDALLDAPAQTINARSAAAHTTLTIGAARALRAFERHRETVRSCFRALKGRLQTELADLSLEMAGETAVRLCLQYGRQRQEWLWWRLSRIVDQFVTLATPASLPAQLELLATRSVLSGLEK